MSGDPRDEPAGTKAYEHVPYDIDVEQALLGSFLQDGNSYWRAVELLQPEHFYDPLHGRIYKTIGELAAQDRKITALTLHAAMKADPGIMEVGGQPYLDALRKAAPALPNIRDFCDILRDLAIRRSIIRAAEIAIEEAYNPPLETKAQEIADRAAEQLFEASQGSQRSVVSIPIREAVQQAAQQAEDAMNQPAGVCLTSGLWLVDEKLGGLYRGDLTILGGAPNMGKTSLLQHILMANASIEALEAGAPMPEEAMFFSLEMMAQQVATRELAMIAKVPSDIMRRGRTSPKEMERLALAASQFPELPYQVDGSRRLSVAQMRARVQARRRRSKRGVSLVGIDHLRFVKPKNPRDDEKDQIQQITSDLKDMATEFNIAIALVSHVNRDANKRHSNRPVLTDLYGSAAIEQNADAVWFIHREIYYLNRNPPGERASGEEKGKHDAAVEKHEGKAEIFAAKQRMGAIGSAIVNFEEKYTQFSDLEPKPEQAEMSLWRQMQGGGP